MNKRAKSILTMTAYALTLLTSQAISAAEATAPVHEPADTVTTQLLNTIKELSNTTNNLSEALLKVLGSKEDASVTTYTERSPSAIIQSIDSLSKSIQASIENDIFISEEVNVIQSSPDSVWFLPAEKQQGGRYMWVPDKNVIDVKAIINGKPVYTPVIPAHDSDINIAEMTYWRGDSIPMALPTKRLGRYDRKLYNWLIYPKGLWHIGLTANYGELNTEDMEILTIVNDIDLKGKIYSIKPSVSYFLRNNLCVGMRLAFTKGDMAINSFKVDIDEDMSFNLHDIRYSSDSYAAAIFLQQYFGLSRRGRFAVFNEAELSVGTGNSHFIRPFGGELRDTRTKTQSFNINYSPGISIMMMKNAAFNLSFGIFGFHLKNEKQWENGEESGNRFTSGINFRFNIFNINFGVAIII